MVPFGVLLSLLTGRSPVLVILEIVPLHAGRIEPDRLPID